MIDAPLYPRFAQPRLVEALADTPVVLVHGPRQCGKTTLARTVAGEMGYAYFSLDDGVAPRWTSCWSAARRKSRASR